MPSPSIRRIAPPCSAEGGRRLLAALTAVLAALLLCVFALCPAPALADDIKYGHSLDGATDYYSVANAWTAATAGTTVVMDYDWHLDECLEVPENTSATIKMNGHKIYRDRVCQNAGRVIKIDEGATLTLDGTGASVEFEYQGLNSQDVWVDLTVTSGGLVTGGFSNDTAGGIDMAGSGATLKLINVAVAGNKA